MPEMVQLMLTVAATEDMEVKSLDVKMELLYGDVPEDQSIYVRRTAELTDADMAAIMRLEVSIRSALCTCCVPQALRCSIVEPGL